MSEELEALIVRKTWRVPVRPGPAGDGSVAARQFDAALMSAGFKCSRTLLEHLSSYDTGFVIDTAVRVLAVVREAVGDHVRHNAYFKNFPFGVPDTMEFWVQCLREALCGATTAAQVEALTVTAVGVHPITGVPSFNLLSLPTYGTYQHAYEELLAAHEEFIPAAGDRVMVLHLGDTLEAEVAALYASLAARTVPPSDEDRGVLMALAGNCLDGPQPETIPVRENRAAINAVRMARGYPLLVDTATDVLRLAAAVSGGDVGLRAPAKLRSFRRPERRILLAALDRVAAGNRAKLGDVSQYAEQWKRLGERLHPHEHPMPGAQDVFRVARGELSVPSFASLVESALASSDVRGAAGLLSNAPGLLFRSLDRLLRASDDLGDIKAVLDAAEVAAKGVSGRVLLSVREHFGNRAVRTDVSRVFVNRNGRARAMPDTREPFPASVIDRVCSVIDAEMSTRLPKVERLVVDPAMLGVALPLSGKTMPSGFGIMPRGSVAEIEGEWLRFFVHWRETSDRTDYDLSALMLDAAFQPAEHISWTGLSLPYAEYSGDITSAADGATEFVNVRLAQVPHRFIVPSVYVYAGEGFGETAESFFGYMLRSAEQKGLPFEPAAVRMKSELRGAGRIALPMVFMRGDDGKWRVKWMHLYTKGHPAFNQVEGAKVTTSLLVRSIVERDYLRVRYLVDLMRGNGAQVAVQGLEPPAPGEPPVTYIGLERPDGLPEGSQIFTLANLPDLIPA